MIFRLPPKIVAAAVSAFAISALSIPIARQAYAQVNPPKFEVDPSWPKPFPHRWVNGDVGGTCVDSQDHVFVTYRNNLTAKEKKIGTAVPPVIELDQEGKVVNSWGERTTMPDRLHGCFVDPQGNVWITGTEDAVVQKYSHDGSKLLLQIGIKGQFDTSDGTLTGNAMNSSHTVLNGPGGLAVDPANGDIYIADGTGNKRVVVFDREGHFVRQWGQQATKAQVDAGIGGGFLKIVHYLALGNDGLIYVCDREADRVEVFDKMGKFVKNFHIESKYHTDPGSAAWVAFSPDQAQKLMYVVDSGDEEIRVLDHATGQTISTFGQPGHQVGEFTFVHSLSVNSKGDLIIGETTDGRRIQMFRLVNPQ
jgi:hypothetical protein